MFWKTKAALMTTAACLSVLTGTSCSTATMLQFSIPREDLGTALKDFSRSSGVQVIVAADVVAGKTSGGATGGLTPESALSEILSGTGLHAELVAGAYVVRRSPSVDIADNKEPPGDSDIVVTGTRIHGAAPIGSPLTVIDREAIETSGRATVADYIQTLPQNFGGSPAEGSVGTNVRNGAGSNRSYGSSIDLRGLGTQSTLVLFDGNRPALSGADGAFVDTSLIPSTALDRIEILTDGASAIYGTDAVAGVVNIRFRDRLDGFDARLYSGSAAGDYQERQASLAWGRRWSDGGITIAYQFDHHSPLAASDRRAGSEDLRSFGGPDNRSDYATPGNIIAANGQVFAISTGQDGRSLTPSQLIAGQENRVDRGSFIDLLPRQTTHSAYVAVDQRLGDTVTLYARALYAHRRFDTILPTDTQQEFEVSPSNPFYVDPIGTGEPVTAHYGFVREVGLPYNPGSVDAITSSAGAKRQIGRWNWDLSGSYGRQIERNRELNMISPDRVQEALDRTDPATALNVFGDGSGNNPATIDFIRAERSTYGRYAVWSASLRIDGPLFDLPAGTVRLAAGLEHRDERFFGYTDSTYSNPTPIRTDLDGTPGHRRVDAVYGEVSVPIFGPRTDRLPGRLDLSLAGRIDRYSDVGTTTNPKIGVRWEPLAGLALRSSYGTSFRAPSFTEAVGTSQNIYFPIYLPDPQSPTGQTAVLSLNGTVASLKPERANSWTTGVDITPKAVPGLALHATYFAINYRDRIGSGTFDYLNYLAQPSVYGSLTIRNPDRALLADYYGSDRFINPYGIPASAIGAIVDLEYRNLSRTIVRGIDFDLNYTHDLAGGNFTLGLSGTRLLAIRQRITAAAPAQEVLGTIYNPVKLRMRGTVGWSKGGFDAHATINYTDGYQNLIVAPAQHVASWTTVDGQIGYRFSHPSPLAGVRLAASAVNLLNRRPPYVENVFADRTLGYDPGQASAIGRLIAVSASLQW